MPELDDEQLAARRLRAGFGFVQIIEVISHDLDDDPTAPEGESIEGARIADPGRRPLRSESKPMHSLPRRSAIPTGEPPARPWMA